MFVKRKKCPLRVQTVPSALNDENDEYAGMPKLELPEPLMPMIAMKPEVHDIVFETVRLRALPRYHPFRRVHHPFTKTIPIMIICCHGLSFVASPAHCDSR